MDSNLEFDYTDTVKLFNLSREGMKLSYRYFKVRMQLGVSRMNLARLLAQAYKNGTINLKMAREKAELYLTTIEPTALGHYETIVKGEEECEGLAELIKSIKSHCKLAESLLQTQVQKG